MTAPAHPAPAPRGPRPAGWDCHVHVFDAAAPVRPGHYQPGQHPLEAIERLAQDHGLGHLVLVQPSVYGTDNSLLLRALESAAGRHRGVAVVDPAITDKELDRLHAAGVRGVRFNLVSPVGQGGQDGDVAHSLLRLAPRLHARGWHVQWYVQGEHLPRLLPWQARTGLCFVLDHLAGLHDGPATQPAAWAAAQALADAGAWIKLSGWYRLQAPPPYDRLHPNIRRAVALFGPRVVWGSDWPHTGFAPEQKPPYASTLAPVLACLDAARTDALLHQQPQALYL